MMEIRQEILNIFAGKTVMLSKYSIGKERKFPDSPLRYALSFRTTEKSAKCYKCKEDNTNWCWNCENPHCDNHARVIQILGTPMLNTFCLECSKEFEKLEKKIRKNKK